MVGNTPKPLWTEQTFPPETTCNPPFRQFRWSLLWFDGSQTNRFVRWLGQWRDAAEVWSIERTTEEGGSFWQQKFHTGNLWVFPKNRGTPKSSIFTVIVIGFSITNHPFWGIPIFGNTPLVLHQILGEVWMEARSRPFSVGGNLKVFVLADVLADETP